MKDADLTPMRDGLSCLKNVARRLATVALVLGLAACATTQNRDPLEPMNRKVFGFNEALDQMFIKPVATGYAAVVQWDQQPQGCLVCGQSVLAGQARRGRSRDSASWHQHHHGFWRFD